MVTSFFAGNITTTDAEERKELTQHGVMPCLAGEEGWGGSINLYSDGRAVPPAKPKSCSAASSWQFQLPQLLVYY
jgi:hypothetical protein